MTTFEYECNFLQINASFLKPFQRGFLHREVMIKYDLNIHLSFNLFMQLFYVYNFSGFQDEYLFDFYLTVIDIKTNFIRQVPKKNSDILVVTYIKNYVTFLPS